MILDFLAKFLIEIVIELILLGLCYWTGWIVLMFLSLGRLNLASRDTYGDAGFGWRGLFSI